MNVVVVGAGVAGVSVAESLATNIGWRVTLVTSDTWGYFARPRLSHGMALADEAVQRIVLKRFDAFPAVIDVRAGAQVVRIDRGAHRILLQSGDTIVYDHLILATGSAARIPPALAPFSDELLTLNSFDDLLALRACAVAARARSGRARWAVVGGGLIGCELASDLHKAGDAVTIFHRASRIMETQLSEMQSAALASHFATLGVEVLVDQDLAAPPRGFDGVVVCTGFAPRVDLARSAGLATARGIVVDAYLRTNDPAIRAIGDAAEVDGRLHAFVAPIRSQATWLAQHLTGRVASPWSPPDFTPAIKVHGFRVEPG